MSDAPGPPSRDHSGAKPREIPWRLVGGIALALYALVLVLLNDKRQSVNFVFFTVNTRLVWLILFSMGLGAALAIVVPRWWRSRRRR